MPSLAHEGNPKEHSITHLDVVATLDIIYSRNADYVGAGEIEKSCLCDSPLGGPLMLKVCSTNNSIGCSSSKWVHVKACGGTPPYTWSKTGNLTVADLTGSVAYVTLNSTIAIGNSPNAAAYIRAVRSLQGAGCAPGAWGYVVYSCSDLELAGNCAGVFYIGLANTGPIVCRDSSCPGPEDYVVCGGVGDPECNLARTIGNYVDVRDEGTIAGGCNPCGVALIGATVSVTDSTGVVATVIIRQ